YSHTYLVHTISRASPLSKESPEQNYRGFFNLAMLLLAVSNLRLAIENYMKYGFLLSLPLQSVDGGDLGWAFVSFAWQLVPLVLAFVIESSSARTLHSTGILHFINISLCLVIPILISWFKISHPFISSLPISTSCVLFLKLISYALVNSDLRCEKALNISPPRVEEPSARHAPPLKESQGAGEVEDDAGDGGMVDVAYPGNVQFGNLVYFVFAPTLSYQASYPRTKRFRRSFFLKRLMEASVGLAALYFLAAQYAAPTLHNSITALENLEFFRLVERVLKLSVISVVMWLLFFWVFFHCWLNMLAEAMRFGDRRFYLTWWNAKDIGTYWRLWNTPVYNWGKRHIYLPMIVNHGISPFVANFAVFFVSAVLHEVLIGVPTHCLNGWAF
ncbi:MBOAT, membrane-bound O-acyltransferase family-domain-containing protein, partial [Blyttiomyces helicus]